MNQVVRFRMAGMGGLGDDTDYWGDLFGAPRTAPTYPTSGGGGGFQWSSLIAPIANFGQTFLQTKYGKDAAKFGAGPYAQQQATQPAGSLTPDQILALVAAKKAEEEDAGAGFKFTSDGLKIGGSTITWPVLCLGVAAIYLIQSPSFSRRR